MSTSKIQPTKFQVTFNTSQGEDFKDFTNLPEAEEFMSMCDGADLAVFDNQLQELELFNDIWYIKDIEPADDGYDYDRYY